MVRPLRWWGLLRNAMAHKRAAAGCFRIAASVEIGLSRSQPGTKRQNSAWVQDVAAIHFIGGWAEPHITKAAQTSSGERIVVRRQ